MFQFDTLLKTVTKYTRNWEYNEIRMYNKMIKKK